MLGAMATYISEIIEFQVRLLMEFLPFWEQSRKTEV